MTCVPFVSVSLSTIVDVFGTRERCTNARVRSSVGMNEKCQPPSLHAHLPSVHRSGYTLVAEPF